MEKFKVMVTANVFMEVEVEAKNYKDAARKTNKGDYKVEKIIDTHSLDIQEINPKY